MATLTLSQRANLDHTSDDFAIGQRVKAHPAADTFMRGDVCTGLSTTLVAAQSDWCWSRWIAVEGVFGSLPAICFTPTNRRRHTQRDCMRMQSHAVSNL